MVIIYNAFFLNFRLFLKLHNMYGYITLFVIYYTGDGRKINKRKQLFIPY